MRMQIMEHTAVNGSVHTGYMQHQRVSRKFCKFACKSAYASCVNGALGFQVSPAAATDIPRVNLQSGQEINGLESGLRESMGRPLGL